VLTESSPVDAKSRIVVPLDLRARLLEWYHTKLVHPGVHRLYNTLRQHYTWPKMMDMIQKYTKKCGPCQKGKQGLHGVGKIPMKDVLRQSHGKILLLTVLVLGQQRLMARK
jgi:hypothetical protein